MSLEYPDYSDPKDRELYEELFYRNGKNRKLTKLEESFVNWMYNMEEGLSDQY